MASITSIFYAFTTFIIVTASLTSQNQVMAQECGATMGDLVGQCGAYVQKTGPKVAPSQGCCNVLKPVNVSCVCKYVNPQIENLVSMEKVVYIARYCGKSVAPGMKCGSYVVPPA